MPQTPAPNPMQKLQADIRACQEQVNQLAAGVRLADIRDQLEDLETETRLLPQRLAQVRSQGYVFQRQLEQRTALDRQQWEALSPGVQSELARQAAHLEGGFRALTPLMQDLAARSSSYAAAAPQLARVQAGVRSLENEVEAAQQALNGMVDDFASAHRSLGAELGRIEELLELFRSATFSLLATEAQVRAVKASWEVNGRKADGDPKGILYLTDQRILFEQKEEIATKKVLFVTTEKQLVHQLKFEFPVVLVEQVTASKEGLFKNEDHLDLALASGAPFPTLHFHLDGQDCREWRDVIGQVKNGDIQRERMEAVAREVTERVRNAPTQCPHCGGAITRPVLRGMETLACDFCGQVIRL